MTTEKQSLSLSNDARGTAQMMRAGLYRPALQGIMGWAE
jgi:hypothetical protein